MRVLLLTHTFNSLSQRLWVALTETGHTLSIEFDINDQVTREALTLFKPDVVVAPFLKRAIPEDVWQRYLCLVVHPGIRGDRGSAALDWALLRDKASWGVTCLQANAVMDAGEIWSWQSFALRPASKSSLYRNEVTEAAVAAVLEAIDRIGIEGFRPQPLDTVDPALLGQYNPAINQTNRAIDWQQDTTAELIRKIRSADTQPGVRSELFAEPVYLYDAHPEATLAGKPGAILAQRDEAVCRATADGAVWIGHVKRIPAPGERSLKLPTMTAFAEQASTVPVSVVDLKLQAGTYQQICYHERNHVGYLAFEFYNGAMSVAQCQRLLQAYEYAHSRPVRVIVLLGGHDFWSNGMNLNVIEAAASPADESWRNINAIDDLARAIITTDDRMTIAALQGNAGAGGVFLALAADRIIARASVILNPHYKNMGNLYGSEYWSYLLPRRVGAERAQQLTQERLPVSAQQAARMGLIDGVASIDRAAFKTEIEALAEDITKDPAFESSVREKARRRREDEEKQPLESYRQQELERMRLNFYGFDPSYHVARYNFVFDIPHSRTPLHLARHRQ